MRALRVYGLVFLSSAVTFGLLATLLGTSLVGTLGGPARGLVSGLFFGLVMAAVLGTLQVVGSRGAPRGASLSPRQTREVAVVAGPDLADRIVTALRTLPAEVTAIDVGAGRYEARRGTSWTTWGEHVVVQLAGDPAQPVATVSSRPRMSLTLVDHGRGRRTVEHVAGALTTG